MIVIENLSVSFGGVQAIRELSTRFDDPVVGVIGPNGAGKTTLLNVFSGFVAHQAGMVTAFGGDLLKLPAHRRTRWGLRRSFQTEQVVDDLTVSDNIRVILDGASGELTKKRDDIDRALDFVGLTARAEILGEELNSYERRMVELAKCVVGAPKLIMLDEPGAGLGDAEADSLRKKILSIHDEFGANIMLIDHDVELIADTCTTTLVLDFGVLIAQGSTADVLQDEKVKLAYLGEEIA
ncbi:MAG: ATP-binding cassette domain-containing protein [Gammaproteobacteria bacterium]|nr:ATP-binding cassette domain-containing protein [Gammaproteobacteria bacterium]